MARTIQTVSPGSGASDALARAVQGPGSSERAGELALSLGLVLALALDDHGDGPGRAGGQPDLRDPARPAGPGQVRARRGAHGGPRRPGGGSGLLLLVAGGAFADAMADIYGWSPSLVLGFRLGRWPVGTALLVVAIAVLFDHAPRRRQPALSWLALGSGIAVLLTLLAAGGLAAYVHVSSSFGSTYGPLAGIVALLVWSLLSAMALFYGARGLRPARGAARRAAGAGVRRPGPPARAAHRRGPARLIRRLRCRHGRRRLGRRYADTELVWSETPNQFVAPRARRPAPGPRGRPGGRRGPQRDLAGPARLGGHGRRLLAGRAGQGAAARRGHPSTGCAPTRPPGDAPASYDLALVAYLQLPADERRAAVRGGFAALRAGGTLLLVAHDSTNLTEGTGGPQDPRGADDAPTTCSPTSAGEGFEVVRAERVARTVDERARRRAGADRTAWDCLVRVERRGLTAASVPGRPRPPDAQLDCWSWPRGPRRGCFGASGSS